MEGRDNKEKDEGKDETKVRKVMEGRDRREKDEGRKRQKGERSRKEEENGRK